MTTRTTFGHPVMVVHELPKGHELVVFRIVRAEIKEDPVLETSMRSHYELGREHRSVRPAVLDMGVSTYLAIDAARETAKRFPVIGSYVARLELRAGNGFNVAQTGHPGHMTVWGHPLKLRDAVVDIVEV